MKYSTSESSIPFFDFISLSICTCDRWFCPKSTPRYDSLNDYVIISLDKKRTRSFCSALDFDYLCNSMTLLIYHLIKTINRH